MLALTHVLHERLYLTVLIYFAALGVWGGVNALRDGAITPRFLGALIVGQVTLVVQGVVGLVLLAGDFQPARLALHLVYGVAVILVLPLAGLYAQGQTARERHTFVAIICVVVCVLAWRGQATSAGAGF